MCVCWDILHRDAAERYQKVTREDRRQVEENTRKREVCLFVDDARLISRVVCVWCGPILPAEFLHTEGVGGGIVFRHDD